MDTIGIQICDAVSQEMWNAYPWREAVQAFAPIPLADTIQDYSSPANFYKLISGQIVRLTPQVESYDPLFVTTRLPVETTIALPPINIRTVGYQKGLGLVRLALMPSINSGESFNLLGDYQMNHTRVTDPTQFAWFGDNLWHVAQEGLLYHGYKLGERVAEAQEQYKIFRGKIAEAWQNENQGSSDSLSPEITLGEETGYWY